MIIRKTARATPIVTLASCHRIVLRILAVAVFATACWQSTHAQDASSKVIRIVVPYAPGAAVDVVGRMLGNVISAQTGRTVIVENRTGARTYTGSEAVLRSEPDGDTLLFTVDDTFTIVPHLTKHATIDPMKQFTPTNMVGAISQAIVVNPKLPVDSLHQFIDYARANPNSMSYGSAGVGSSAHLALEMLKFHAKIDMVHVPYRGLAPAATGLITGEVQASVLGYGSSKALIEAGKLKPIAITSADRVPSLPNVPTTRELGHPQVQASGRLMLALSAKTPQDVQKRISDVIARAVSDPKFRHDLEARDIVLMDLGPKEAAIELERLSKLYGEAVRIARIDPD